MSPRFTLSTMVPSPRALLLATASLVLGLGNTAFAQEEGEEDPPEPPPTVIVAPYSSAQPDLPHPGHELAPVTLKAILRDAVCPTGYEVRWDIDRNGLFSDDQQLLRGAEPLEGQTVYSLSQTHQLPRVQGDEVVAYTVQVTSTCDDRAVAYGTHAFLVRDWEPDGDPARWTAEQRRVMRQIAAREALWSRHLAASQGRTPPGPQMSTRIVHPGGAHREAVTAAATIKSMSLGGHQPAFPPDAELFNPEGVVLDGPWKLDNDARWAADPLAETQLRLLHTLILSGAGFEAVNIADEINTCGIDESGNELTCAPIEGTDDGRGVWIGAARDQLDLFSHATALSAVISVLPTLGDVPIQVGPEGIRGQSWRWLAQQMIDLLASAQLDVGCGAGGWAAALTPADGAAGCEVADLFAGHWAIIALSSAEAQASVGEGQATLVVNNRVKYRLADYLRANQLGAVGGTLRSTEATDGGARRTIEISGAGESSHQMTAVALLGARWLGLHTLAPGDDQPFAGQGFTYSTATADELREMYARLLAYDAQGWRDTSGRGAQGEVSRLWSAGDPTCGDIQRSYNVAARCGNTYAMLAHQHALSTFDPPIDLVGVNDWRQDFDVYQVRAQSRNIFELALFGETTDLFCDGASITCDLAGPPITSAWASELLVPELVELGPVASGAPVPEVVNEGCAGPTDGMVRFSHNESFVSGGERRLVGWDWDVDDSDGLWWETGVAPDFTSDNASSIFTHRYVQQGVYTATLRVRDDQDASSTITRTVTVRGLDNQTPVVDAGGPYTAGLGEAVTLTAHVQDPNIACGQAVTVRWDLDDDGAYDDGEGMSLVLDEAFLEGLALNRPHPIGVLVNDGEAATAAQTTLTIYAPNPSAVLNATPTPTLCDVEVELDASESFHPDPAHQIVRYQWSLDGEPGFERETRDPVLVYRFNRGGQIPVVLRVIDDQGLTGQTLFTVDAGGGNQPPIAIPDAALFIGETNRPLTLSAHSAFDPDRRCDDQIVEWAWDLDNDGAYDGLFDGRGVEMVIDSDTLALLVPESPLGTDLPTLVGRLRVTDRQGATAETTFGVVRQPTGPVAVIEQWPNPAPIDTITGRTVVSLDARQSAHPNPDIDIVSYQWDLDDDGIYEIIGGGEAGAIVDLERFTLPIPTRNSIPDLNIRLRLVDSTGSASVTLYTIRRMIEAVAPTADADPQPFPEPGYHVLVGEDLVLDASGSFDPLNEGDYIRRYRWDFLDDGDYEIERIDDDGDGAEAITIIPADELFDLGIETPLARYPVRLQVRDRQALPGEDLTSVTLHPVGPVSRALVQPNPAACGPDARILFDIADSDHGHPDIDLVSWAWDLDGDGEYDDSADARFWAQASSFSFDGPLDVGLRLEDSTGEVTETRFALSITAGNNPPVVDSGGPYPVQVGSDLFLDASGTFDVDGDCGDDVVRYLWDFNGDGETDLEVEDPVAEVDWATLVALGVDQRGTWITELTAVDRLGATAVARTRLEIYEGPQAIITSAETVVGCQADVQLSGAQSFSDAPGEEGVITDWAWDTDGDGQFDDGTGPQLSFRAQGDGVRTIALRVTDGGGLEDTTQLDLTINVNNLPPVAQVAGPYVTGPVRDGEGLVVEFQPITIDGRSSYDPNAPCDEIVAWAWDTDGDGQFGADDANGAPGQLGSDYTGPVIEDYVNPNWLPGTSQVVFLRVQDARGVNSAPTPVVIQVRDSVPPQGVLLSPSADETQCIGIEGLTIEYAISDADGDALLLTVLVDGEILGEPQLVDVPENGDLLEGDVTFAPEAVDEGLHHVAFVVDDGGGQPLTLDAGTLLFDRTAPQIAASALPVEGGCYPLGTPGAELEVYDALDPFPTLSRTQTEGACTRSQRLVATDTCGNTSEFVRTWQVGINPRLTLDAPSEGVLSGSTSITWDHETPADCRLDEPTVTLARQGGGVQVYTEGSLIDQPGVYRLDALTRNCIGEAFVSQREFSINGPPQVMGTLHHTVVEGEPLLLDMSGSTPPEVGDVVAEYRWDLDGDGDYELIQAAGVPVEADAALLGTLAGQINFPTDQVGVFRPQIQVIDGFGASTNVALTISVVDAAPQPATTGPYSIVEGQALAVDGRPSQPGSPLDGLTGYVWRWGDGTPDTSGIIATHTYTRDGVFTAELTVIDQDSRASIQVPVRVVDAPPVIVELSGPAEPFASAPQRFSVSAQPGVVSDPLQAYSWDFGDGTQVRGADLFEVEHTFDAPGTYTITATVHDTDSETRGTLVIDVRAPSLLEALEQIERSWADRVEASPPAAANTLDGARSSLDRALWFAQRDVTGSALNAAGALVQALSFAAGQGATVDDWMWLLLTQTLKETEALNAIVAELDLIDERERLAAEPVLVEARAQMADPTLRETIAIGRLAWRANDVWLQIFAAYDLLARQQSPCLGGVNNRYLIPPPGFQGIDFQVNLVADRVTESFATLAFEIQQVLDLGNALPGRAALSKALLRIREAQLALGEPGGIECQGPCMSDALALEIRLDLMDASIALSEARLSGLYDGPWQTCLANTLRFRENVWTQRLSEVCGAEDQWAADAEVRFDITEQLLDFDFDLYSALDHSRDQAGRCLALRGYNRCFARVGGADPVDLPPICGEAR
ncbi:MAG: PKD domain-containing protein [Bradymonadia bacterium]